MKKTGITFLIGLLALCACEEKKETPKVTYNETKSETSIQEIKIDTTQIKVADLPVLMEGTKYLIHAIGDVRIYEKSNSKFGSSQTNSVSYSISNYNRFELTGYLNNLKFQHLDSTSVYTLTDRAVEIHTVTYLENISKKINKGILVYSVVDNDTNKDSKINSNDIKTLYLSEINGRRFTKISEELEELIDWNTIEAQNRLYFRTIEDINKNGSFDDKDLVNYYYVQLNSPEWKATKYELND